MVLIGIRYQETKQESWNEEWVTHGKTDAIECESERQGPDWTASATMRNTYAVAYVFDSKVPTYAIADDEVWYRGILCSPENPLCDITVCYGMISGH